MKVATTLSYLEPGPSILFASFLLVERQFDQIDARFRGNMTPALVLLCREGVLIPYRERLMTWAMLHDAKHVYRRAVILESYYLLQPEVNS